MDFRKERFFSILCSVIFLGWIFLVPSACQPELSYFYPDLFICDKVLQSADDSALVHKAGEIKGAGFLGVETSEIVGLKVVLNALDANELNLYALHWASGLGSDLLDFPKLRREFELLQGRGVVLIPEKVELSGIHSSGINEGTYVKHLRQLSDSTSAYSLKIGLSCDVSLQNEVTECVRLVKKVNRKRVGIVLTIDLEHDLKDLPTLLEEIIPYIQLVYINGLHNNKAKIDLNIQRMENEKIKKQLGSVLQILKDTHYSGPVGLTCASSPALDQLQVMSRFLIDELYELNEE